MNNYRRALIFVALLLCAALCCGCAGENPSGSKSKKNSSTAAPATFDEADAPEGLADLGIDPGSAGIFPQIKHDENNSAGFQLESPKEGDTVAVIHTSLGDITLRLFPEQAPKAVTNFISLAENGSYNGTAFNYVQRGAYIRGGSCGSSGNPYGVSSYGGTFEDEFCDSLCNLRGAVSMANNAKDANGSSFLINRTDSASFAEKGGWKAYESAWVGIVNQLSGYKGSNLLQAYIDENGDRFFNPALMPQNVKELYEQNGGNPSFDGAYNAADRGNTVFAQVIDGMEVVDAIDALETDKNNAPLENVVIKSVEITVYHARPAA